MNQSRKVGAHRRARLVGAAVAAAVLAGSLGGCVYRSEKEKVVPPVVTTAPPAVAAPTVVMAPSDRVVTAADGRWQLYGDGTTASPYYWAWIPAGASPPPPPPLPRR
jgi:hypothetical protein